MHLRADTSFRRNAVASVDIEVNTLCKAGVIACSNACSLSAGKSLLVKRTA